MSHTGQKALGPKDLAVAEKRGMVSSWPGPSPVSAPMPRQTPSPRAYRQNPPVPTTLTPSVPGREIEPPLTPVYNELYANVVAPSHDLGRETPPLPTSYDTDQSGPYDILREADCLDCGMKVVELPPPKSCALIVKGECPKCGTNVAKIIYCGREWCLVCGQPWSVVHQRKFARLLPKAMELRTMGFFVIEFPDRYRKIPGWTYSKMGLRKAGDRIVSVLAGNRTGRGARVGGYFPRGFMRWHWFGDVKAGKYNPHNNVIVEAGFLPPEKIEAIKSDLSRALLCPDLIVNYSYRQAEPEMVHTVKYITRSTFRDEQWDGYMAKQIHGFRNIRSWGKWSGVPVWDCEGSAFYLAIEKLERGLCPDCGGHLNWGKKALSLHYLRGWQDMGLTTPLGGGYFKLRFPGRGRSDREPWVEEVSCRE